MRHIRGLFPAFLARLLLVGWLYSGDPHLQFGDSPTWMYQTGGLALGKLSMYRAGVFWPPLFRGLMAAFFFLFGFSIRVPLALNISLGLAALALCYVLTLLLFDRTTAVLAAILCALMPVGVFLSLSSMAEPLYVVLLLVFFLCYLRYWGKPREWRLHVFATIALALALLTRYEGLTFFAGFAALEAVMLFRRPSRPHAAKLMAAGILIPSACLLAWMMILKHVTGDAWAWINVTRRDHADMAYAYVNPAWRFISTFGDFYPGYSWLILLVCLALIAARRRTSLKDLPASFALANLAALAGAACLNLDSQDNHRNVFAPIVLLAPYMARLLRDAWEQWAPDPHVPKVNAGRLLMALLAIGVLRDLGQVVSYARVLPTSRQDEWAAARELGLFVRELADHGVGGLSRWNIACVEAAHNGFCTNAAAYSGLPMRTRGTPALYGDKGWYALERCSAAAGAVVLKRAGASCFAYHKEERR